MKTVLLLTLLAMPLLSFPCVSDAAGIYQTEYKYSFEGIACAPRLAFVVCDNNCTMAPYLIRAPKALTLSVRVSQDGTGDRVLKTPSAGIGTKPETSKNVAGHERPDPSPPKDQDMAPKRTSVLFTLDRFTLDASGKAKLSSFIAGAKDRKDLSVSVEGYTCDLGSQAHNDALAKKRAETVALYLEKAGVHPTRVTGTGRCCYVTEEADKRSLNRRVEITIDTGETRR